MQERIQNEKESPYRRRQATADDAAFQSRSPVGDLRTTHLLTMQRTVGNRAVQRQMNRVQRFALGDLLGGGGIGSMLSGLLEQLTGALGGLLGGGGGGGIGSALSGLMGQATGALGGLLGGGGGGGIGGALSGLMGQATGALGGLASRAREWLGGLF